MIWLDFKLFGNGFGLKSPFFDDKFYWLVDTQDKERNGKHGNFYKWIGGFGAQLNSFEWKMPKPGTRRRLLGKDFVIFLARRRGLRVDASWRLAQEGLTIEDIRSLQQELDSAT